MSASFAVHFIGVMSVQARAQGITLAVVGVLWLLMGLKGPLPICELSMMAKMQEAASFDKRFGHITRPWLLPL